MNSQRWKRSFGWGVIATVVMSIPMVIGVSTGVAPMPKPIPVAMMAKVLGSGVAAPVLMLLGATAHMAYGGLWGAALAELTRPVTVWKGIALGVALWLGMQVVILPFIGWGLFGLAITPAVAVVTFFLHLLYGTTLGWWLDRQRIPLEEHATS